MKHFKDNILIYISLFLSSLVFIVPLIVDTSSTINEIKTIPTSYLVLNIVFYIFILLVLAFTFFLFLMLFYIMSSMFYELYKDHKRSKAKAEDSIFAAIRLNNIRALNHHISSGIDLNTINEDGSTPLHRAIEGDWNTERKTENLEIIRLLIDKGADVNVKDDNENTPLHLSTNRKISELLIGQGADVNAKDCSGGTPLHSIIFNEDKDLVALLITNGADLNSMNEDGETPLDCLSSEQLIGVTAEIENLIRKHGGRTSEELKGGGKIIRANKRDPNHPNPKKPWCPNCQAHTEYTIGYRSVGESRTVTTYSCNPCGKIQMFIPTHNKEKILNYKKWGIWLPAIFVPGFPLLFYCAGIIALGYVLSGCLCIPIILMFWVTIRVLSVERNKWLSWARERGYAESS